MSAWLRFVSRNSPLLGITTCGRASSMLALIAHDGDNGTGYMRRFGLCAFASASIRGVRKSIRPLSTGDTHAR